MKREVLSLQPEITLSEGTLSPFLLLLSEMLEQELKRMMELALEDSPLFLVEVVSNSASTKFQFLVDGVDGVSIDECAKVSRKVSRMIDEQDLGDRRFTFEVSSPGADRPLKLKEQYFKHVGRELMLETKSGQKERGKLLSVLENGLELELKGEKKKETQNVNLNFDEIRECRVELNFKSKK